MTLTEAYELLDLPEGTDLQQVRQRFIEQHSEYRMQIDNAPTPNLRQRYEKNLALREEAFNLITGGSSLDDSQDLPSAARFEEESNLHSEGKNNAHKTTVNTEPRPLTAALALLGVQETTSPAHIKSAYLTLKSELEAELKRARTETIKQAYQTELLNLGQGWTIIDRWLKSKSQEPTRQKSAENEEAPGVSEATRQGRTSVDNKAKGQVEAGKNLASKKEKNKKPLVWAATLILVLLMFGFYTFRPSEKNKDSNINGQTASTPVDKDSIILVKIALLKKEHPKDTTSLLNAYQEGAQAGIAECQYQYGVLLNAHERPIDGFDMLTKAAAQNHAKANSELAYMYFDGVQGVVEKDIAKAKSLYEKAAAADNSVAILMLGIMHKQGLGVKKDVLKANNYFRRVVQLDDNPDAVSRANQEVTGN